MRPGLARHATLFPTNGCSHSNNFPFLCSLCTNEITDIVSYVTNQSTGDCNQHRFSRVLKIMHLIVVSWLGKRRRRFWKVFVALFLPLQKGLWSSWKSSQMNWRESSRIANFPERSALILNVEWRNPSFVLWDRKSSKCLQFDPINSTCTSNATANSSTRISTAISQQVRYYTPARFPIGSIGVSMDAGFGIFSLWYSGFEPKTGAGSGN